jgi:hypothetical protein
MTKGKGFLAMTKGKGFLAMTKGKGLLATTKKQCRRLDNFRRIMII